VAAFLFAVRVSERVAIEFEPSFSGPYSREYTYHPTASIIANVFASWRDTLFSFQARIRAGVLEPVVGVSYVHGTISRHAILYSDDGSRSDDGVAIVGGADAPITFARHFYFVPTFRVLLVT
jgi:hypothetical protein